MTARQLRRAQEHKARKLARKTAGPDQSLHQATQASPPVEDETRSQAANHYSPLSQARLEANRANSQFSTGPRTAEGKAISSRNNLRHGFHGAFCVLPSEDGPGFVSLCSDLLNEHNPATLTERLLVIDMARHYWLVQRALRFQDACFIPEAAENTDVGKALALYIRYQTTHQRAFHRCLADLLKLRKSRPAEQVGFESQNTAAAVNSKSEDLASQSEDPPSPPHFGPKYASKEQIGFESQNGSTSRKTAVGSSNYGMPSTAPDTEAICA